jgi:hypothetical protein
MPATLVDDNDFYWCEPCGERHEGESPEMVGSGFHGNNCGSLGEYTVVDEDYRVDIYQCADGNYIDEEDWHGMAAHWICTTCGMWWSLDDYDDESAKKWAEQCCEPTNVPVTINIDLGTGSGTNAISAIASEMDKIAVTMTTLNTSLTAARVAGTQSEIIKAEDVTAESFK